MLEKVSLLAILVLSFTAMINAMTLDQEKVRKGIRDVASHNYLVQLEAAKLERVKAYKAR